MVASDGPWSISVPVTPPAVRYVVEGSSLTAVIRVRRAFSLAARSTACVNAWSACGEPSTATRMFRNMTPLNTLDSGPRRVTELAELEGLAQPTMTLLLKQLEQRRLVRRERRARDGRVVLVSVSDARRAALKQFRAEAQTALRSYLAEMSDEQVEALSTTAEALQSLIVLLQRGAVG